MGTMQRQRRILREQQGLARRKLLRPDGNPKPEDCELLAEISARVFRQSLADFSAGLSRIIAFYRGGDL